MAGPEIIGTGISIIKGVTDALSGKRISLTSDHVSTDFYKCDTTKCQWKEKDEPWLISSANMWPIKRWRVAELHVYISFEYNGCDINNARLRLANETFMKWYNDRATYKVAAQGSASRLRGDSGCPKCCSQSACVVFDVQIAATWDFIRSGVESYEVKICGDGSVTKKSL